MIDENMVWNAESSQIVMAYRNAQMWKKAYVEIIYAESCDVDLKYYIENQNSGGGFEDSLKTSKRQTKKLQQRHTNYRLKSIDNIIGKKYLNY